MVQEGRSRIGQGTVRRVRKVKFVVGIEDRVYMHWQLSILLESLRGKLPKGWEPWVVVCNDHRALSIDLQRMLDAYGTRYFTGTYHPHRENMDFAGGGDIYVPINRIEALNIVADYGGIKGFGDPFPLFN